jgi:type II secretory pathway pseudopilin PulG
MSPSLLSKPSRFKVAFSMVELLAAVAIMGIIAFMAIPSVTKMRSDGERNLAISRVESLNIAMASFVQAEGRSRAENQWQSAGNNTARYTLLRPYLAFAEDTNPISSDPELSR